MRQNMGLVLKQEDVSRVLRQWFVGLVICGLVFGLDRLHMLSGMRGGIEQSVRLVDIRISGLTKWILSPLSFIRQSIGRQERMAKLEQQLAMAAVNQRKMAELESKVSTLEAMLLAHQTGVKASTLAELYVTRGDALVGLGEVGGVVSGQVVTDKNGILVGKIGSVGRYVSRIERVGSEGMKIPAQTASGQAKGVVYIKSGVVVLAEVLQTENLVPGDIVVTSGFDSGFPPGLVIGQVEEIKGEAASVTKEGTLKLLAEEKGWVAIW